MQTDHLLEYSPNRSPPAFGFSHPALSLEKQVAKQATANKDMWLCGAYNCNKRQGNMVQHIFPHMSRACWKTLRNS